MVREVRKHIELVMNNFKQSVEGCKFFNNNNNNYGNDLCLIGN